MVQGGAMRHRWRLWSLYDRKKVMVPMEPLIVVEGLTHVYNPGTENAVMALSGINLKIDRGEFVAIIGPNGSGKSTLARHLNGLLMPTQGRVLVDGMDTRNEEDAWRIRQITGMVFQNPDNQIVATVVEEDVAFGPENLAVPPAEIKRRVAEALRIVDMEGYRLHAPHLLSGGQKQRVAIAGIIAMKPRCIILDEPTAMLDPLGRTEVMRTVKKLNEGEGSTVVYITHFMAEAVEARRVMVMDDGKIVMDGPPEQVFSQGGELKRLGLDVPQVAELARELRRHGVGVGESILTVDEMVNELCR